MKKILVAIILFNVSLFAGVELINYEPKVVVGDYYFSHETMECRNVYKIVNEKGERVYILEEYLDETLDTYKKNGTLNTKVLFKGDK